MLVDWHMNWLKETFKVHSFLRVTISNWRDDNRWMADNHKKLRGENKKKVHELEIAPNAFHQFSDCQLFSLFKMHF